MDNSPPDAPSSLRSDACGFLPPPPPQLRCLPRSLRRGGVQRFDEEMTLKEDYDYTAQHIARHGGILRCNRMTVSAKHHAPGGAESLRDKKGLEEQRNIAILLRKWPKAFRAHPKRKNEVVLQWPRGGLDAEDRRQAKRPSAEAASHAAPHALKRPASAARA